MCVPFSGSHSIKSFVRMNVTENGKIVQILYYNGKSKTHTHIAKAHSFSLIVDYSNYFIWSFNAHNKIETKNTAKHTNKYTLVLITNIQNYLCYLCWLAYWISMTQLGLVSVYVCVFCARRSSNFASFILESRLVFERQTIISTNFPVCSFFSSSFYLLSVALPFRQFSCISTSKYYHCDFNFLLIAHIHRIKWYIERWRERVRILGIHPMKVDSYTYCLNNAKAQL